MQNKRLDSSSTIVLPAIKIPDESLHTSVADKPLPPLQKLRTKPTLEDFMLDQSSAYKYREKNMIRSRTRKPCPISRHLQKRNQASLTISAYSPAQWLFFKGSRWVPLDYVNHQKLENTILCKGTFIDIIDSHFPEVKKVRVFPESDYLSYLGTRYKICKILLPNII